jgi:hypothetical protein
MSPWHCHKSHLLLNMFGWKLCVAREAIYDDHTLHQLEVDIFHMFNCLYNITFL